MDRMTTPDPISEGAESLRAEATECDRVAGTLPGGSRGRDMAESKAAELRARAEEIERKSKLTLGRFCARCGCAYAVIYGPEDREECGGCGVPFDEPLTVEPPGPSNPRAAAKKAAEEPCLHFVSPEGMKSHEVHRAIKCVKCGIERGVHRYGPTPPATYPHTAAILGGKEEVERLTKYGAGLKLACEGYEGLLSAANARADKAEAEHGAVEGLVAPHESAKTTEEEIARLKEERDKAVAFASRVERGDVAFIKGVDAQMERIAKMPVGKLITEDLADAVARTIKERDSLRSRVSLLERAICAKDEALEKITSVCIVPIVGLAQFGTPGRVRGARCKLCGAECVPDGVMDHCDCPWDAARAALSSPDDLAERYVAREEMEKVIKETEKKVKEALSHLTSTPRLPEEYEAELGHADKAIAACEAEDDWYGINFHQGLRSGIIHGHLVMHKERSALTAQISALTSELAEAKKEIGRGHRKAWCQVVDALDCAHPEWANSNTRNADDDFGDLAARSIVGLGEERDQLKAENTRMKEELANWKAAHAEQENMLLSKIAEWGTMLAALVTIRDNSDERDAAWAQDIARAAIQSVTSDKP